MKMAYYGFITISNLNNANVPDGYEIAAILLILPIALPIIATKAAYDWTSKKLTNLSMPSLPSIRLPTFTSKHHQFDYKAKFTL